MSNSNDAGSFRSSKLVLHSPSAIMDTEEDEATYRTIHTEPQEGDEMFPNNHIRTAKYSLLTFLPLNMFEQFRRLANFYFLVIVSLQAIPGVTPFPFFVILIPLVVLLGISAVKEAVIDVARHREDRITNRRLYARLSKQHPNGKLVESQRLRVGDVVRVNNGEFFPADLILLLSSNMDNSCYVNTANLDGETVPKVKHAFQRKRYNIDQIAHLDIEMQAATPVARFNGFEGTLKVHDETYPLGDDQLALRGSKLTNCEFVYGIVYATGRDTKLMLNQNLARFKFSSFEKNLNYGVLYALAVQMGINFFITGMHSDMETFDELYRGPFERVWKEFITTFILFSFFVPMSLYFTIEFVRILQAKLVEYDTAMAVRRERDVGLQTMSQAPMDEEEDEEDEWMYTEVKSSSILDELGQIDVILSDKTGTLTQNKMTLRTCLIGGAAVHVPLDDTEPELEAYRLTLSDYIQCTFIPTYTQQLIPETMTTARSVIDAESWAKAPSTDFLLALLVCHEITILEDAPGVFNSLSPDEIAFAEAMRSAGVELVQSDDHIKVVKFAGKERKRVSTQFTLHGVLRFSADRKRMSVVVQDTDGTYKLLTKGADHIVRRFLCEADQTSPLKTTDTYLERFAQDGNRTLLVSSRTLSDSEFDSFKKEYTEATLALQHRESRIEHAFASIETDMRLLGCTSVEDPLQVGVPETVDRLVGAGVKLIVLTGDKQETAVAIGKQSRIIAEGTRLVIIHSEALGAIEAQLKQLCDSGSGQGPSLVLVISGNALAIAVQRNPDLFMAALAVCSTVICNRATPAQKADMVYIMKHKLKQVTLCIGDGANDVTMIQMADVGVGLRGKEGSQAAQASDFVIHRFEFLQRLMLIHGRYGYLRMRTLVYWGFYKNFFYCIPLFLFAFFCDFSNQAFYEYWLLNGYNIVFTVLAPFFIGLTEKDYTEEQLLQQPHLYASFRDHGKFSLRTFIQWTTFGILQGIALFLITLGIFYDTEVVSSDGKATGMWVFGMWQHTVVIIVVNITFLLLAKNATPLFIGGCLFGIGINALGYAIWSNTNVFPLIEGINTYMWDNALFYLYLFITIPVLLLPSLLHRNQAFFSFPLKKLAVFCEPIK